MSSARTQLDSLTAAWIAFQREWRDARAQWRDRVGDDFSRRFWEDWERRMPSLMHTMEQLDTAMSEAENLLREGGRR